MGKLASIGLAVLGIGLVAGLAGCSSSNPTGSAAQKSAFCGANIAIDKASANVNSQTDFVTVLKAHRSQLSTMQNNLPGGSLGTEARDEINAADQAIAKNSANPLNSIPSTAGGDLDTYCGVDGSGNPLPSYFAAGKGTALCSVNSKIDAGTANAQGPSDILAFLKAHQDLVSQFAADMSSLPSSLTEEGQQLVTSAQQAIATNNANLLNQTVLTDAMDMDLYCGQNQ
jgi:hypothetical protein